MPLTVQGGYIILHDGAIASATLWSEHVEIVLPAVRLPVSLVEAFLPELFATLGTEEVLRVPSFLQRGYAFVENGAVAVGATGREKIVIVGLAVGLTLPLEEVPRSQLLVAVGAREVFRVPRFSQGGDHLSHDGLLAGAAASLLSSVHTLTTHVCLEVP